MKHFFKNIFSSIMFKLVTIFTSLIIQRQVLLSFGSSINGITSSINQFLTYLALLEAGIGAASVQALYKPLSDNDYNEANGILSATKNQYIKVGIIFGILLLGVSFLMPIIVAGQVDAIVVCVITFLSGVSSLITYLMLGKYTVLLNADKHIWVLYYVDTGIAVLSCILRFVAMRMGYGIIVVTAILGICSLIKFLICFIYVRFKYKWLSFSEKPNYAKVSKHKSVLVHHLSGVVVSHTDVTILTLFSSLKVVSVYTVYNFIYANIAALLTTVFQQASQSTFGYYATKTKEEYNSKYSVFEYFYYLVLYFVMTVALVMTIPFITLYTKGVSDVNYIDYKLAILFCLIQLMNLIRIPSIMTINSYGLFKETQKGAIIEAVINIVVSVSLFPFLGIYGLLIGTVVSYCFRTQDCVIYIYRHCGLSLKTFLKNNIVNILSATAIILFFTFVITIKADTWFEWIVWALIVSAVTMLLLFAVNYIFEHKRMIFILKTLGNRLFKNHKKRSN